MSDLSDLPPLPEAPAARDALPSAGELQRLREWAFVDDITGLANRRHFLHLAQTAVHQAEVQGQALVLLAFRVPRVGQLARTVGLNASHRLCMALAARFRILGTQGLLGPGPPSTPASAVACESTGCRFIHPLAHLGEGDFLALLPLALPVNRDCLQQQAQAWLEPVAGTDSHGRT